MSKKVFSREEIASLAANPYTHRVSDRQISFTKEFKEKFWQEYNAGKTPAEIVKECGYEVDVLGLRRIEGIRGHICICPLKNRPKVHRKPGHFLSGSPEFYSLFCGVYSGCKTERTFRTFRLKKLPGVSVPSAIFRRPRTHLRSDAITPPAWRQGPQNNFLILFG